MKELKQPQRDFAFTVNIGSATLSSALKGETLIDPSTEELLFIKIDRLRDEKEKSDLFRLTPKHFSSRPVEYTQSTSHQDGNNHHGLTLAG